MSIADRTITITVEDRQLGSTSREFKTQLGARKFIAEMLELHPELALGNSRATITWSVSRRNDDPHWSTVRYAREFAARENIKRLREVA